MARDAVKIVLISGSPAGNSRSATLLEYVAGVLRESGAQTTELAVRNLPPDELLFPRGDAPPIQRLLRDVKAAHAIVIATPVYKGSFSGALKVLLDLLPENGLAEKAVLPIATAGGQRHALAVEYALIPVLSTLGATHILGSVYAIDSQFHTKLTGKWGFEADLAIRLRRAADELFSSARAASLAQAQAAASVRAAPAANWRGAPSKTESLNS